MNIEVPGICLDLTGALNSMADWFTNSLDIVGALLLAAAALFVAFVGWRAFKAAINKV